MRDLLGLPADAAKWPQAPDIGVAEPLGGGGGIFGSAAPATPVWPYAFPGEARVDGFEGMAKGQASSSYAVEQLQSAARHFGTYVLVSPIFFVCDDKTWATLGDGERDACAVQSLLRFAQRAWRRPITQVESDRLASLWQTMALIGSPQQAIALAASGILQSPSFLFRIERGDLAAKVGDAIPLTDWELASRLSYALWDTMPDVALFAAAASGQLHTRAQLQTAARRMLKDPRAVDAVVRFHHQWLGTDQLHRISPARRIYGPLFGIKPVQPLDTTGDGEWPALMGPLRRSLEVETELFIKAAIFGEGANTGTLTALLTRENGYVSKYTAPIYGVGSCDSVAFPGGSSGGKGAGCVIDGSVVDLAAAKAVSASTAYVAAVSTLNTFTLHPATFPVGQRAGVLTLPSVLALGAHPVHPSPILRGKRLLERIACVHFGSPPAIAEASAPADTPSDDSSNRERTIASTKAAECSGCHEAQGMNMAGFAFEHYDSFGHWRGQDGGKAVDASGKLTLPGEAAMVFANGVDLAQQLAKSPVVRDCYVRKQLSYVAGIEIPSSDPTLKALQAAFAKDDDVVELMVAIVGSELFRYRRADAGQGVSP